LAIKTRLLKIGCLWRKESGEAGEYSNGSLGRIPPGVVLKEGTKIFIFRNREPRGPDSPTHFIMTPVPDKPKDPQDPNW